MIQNNSLRATKRGNRDYPVQKLHDEIEIDYLCESRKKSSLKIVHRGLRINGPAGLNNLFNYYEPSHSSFGEQTLAIRGSKYWNSVDIDID